MGHPAQFGQIGSNPGVLVDFGRDMAVEIAIRAFRLTKWPVDIEPEPSVAPIFSQNSLR